MSKLTSQVDNKEEICVEGKKIDIYMEKKEVDKVYECYERGIFCGLCLNDLPLSVYSYAYPNLTWDSTYNFTLENRWVYRLKGGGEKKRQAGLVFKGMIIEGALISHKKVSSIMKMISIIGVLALVVVCDFELKQFDLKNIFLYIDLSRKSCTWNN